ncbi:WYL domain-containing protein [Streptacidiphilus sp. PB12-B1b]|uniref:helicase-associated domain-containing protein n=1 Tax=Streptacidiphilus sp. PB12-B1b TaxID=2705012 RepID=UPI0015FD9B80|nr:helicase-associated domain-containing protein [Streptacidiphilus sp. PB12-B1b]QMU74943.1 WYL domain-containing protein [Streptacidiphilus sp. PB12-B1b]
MSSRRNGKSGSTAAPRTLAEELRARPDDGLTALLRSRPDLLHPVPGDLTQLSTRLSTKASVVRALERLDRFTLQTAEALAVAPDDCPRATLVGLLGGADPDAALAALRTQALVWGPDQGLRLVRTVRDVLAPAGGTPGPTGLGPTFAEASAGLSPGRLQDMLADAGLPATHDPVSAVAALTALWADHARAEALLAGAVPGVKDVLRRLMWGPPYGGAQPRAVRAAEARTPVEWLQARGVLLPAGPENVVLPREVALHLRGGRAHQHVEARPPAVEAVAVHDPAQTDRAAAARAFTAVRTVEEALDLWSTDAPAVLRTGGLGVRELRRTATALDLPEPETAFWLELAFGAGLLASGEAQGARAEASQTRTAADAWTDRWMPTPLYDEWLRRRVAERWLLLVGSWLAGTRVAALAGTKDAKDKVLSALGEGLDRAIAPEVRRAVLLRLAELAPGSAADRASLLARIQWQSPLRGGATRDRLVGWTLTEAEQLGLTGRGAAASYAALLLDAVPAGGDPAAERAADERVVAALAPLLPEPLDHVILQPDLTAIAPGPLHTPLAQTLAVAADIESKGGATVYRFTPESVRRALDAGRSADELHAFLARHSQTPVPQPLSYLIDDVARRHGRLRVGAASAYLRCDDDALLSELLADRRAASLRLRRLAPTVLAAQADPGSVLAQLRAMGYAPAAESPDGDVLISRPDARRTPPRSAPAPVPDGPPPVSEAMLGAAVKAVRAGDRAATAVRREPEHPPSELPRTAAAETLAALQTAVLTGERVWIGYVNAEGSASQQVVEPVRVAGGFVTAYDQLREEMRTFSLHRITGVAELAEDS